MKKTAKTNGGKKSDRVTVHIVASQRVRYSQEVTMDRADWERIKKTSPGEMGDEGGPLAMWLDLRDVLDGDDFEDFELELVDKDSKPVKPRDRYELG